MPTFNMVRPIFISGLHNIGYIMALVLMVMASSKLVGHFFFEKDFKIIEVHTQCEQPLNNRCLYMYRIETADGVRSWDNFINLRVNEGDLQVGNHVDKAKYKLDYEVNGKLVRWRRWSEFWLAVGGAILFAGIAWLTTPRPEGGLKRSN